MRCGHEGLVRLFKGCLVHVHTHVTSQLVRLCKSYCVIIARVRIVFLAYRVSPQTLPPKERALSLCQQDSSHMLFPSRLCSCLTAALFPRGRAPPPAGLSTTAAGDAPRGKGVIAIEKAAELLRSGQCRRVVVLTGAGISVSAGIPDFRTPGTGLYDNLQEYGLPFAEAIFDLNFFRSNPAPFYRLCQELWPGRYAPTPTHRFIKLLNQKELLVRCDTLNTALPPTEHLAQNPSHRTAHARLARP